MLRGVGELRMKVGVGDFLLVLIPHCTNRKYVKALSGNMQWVEIGSFGEPKVLPIHGG